MTVPADELADLRRALRDGRWEHLTDPLLPLLLLNDAGVWWPEAVGSLSLSLVVQLAQHIARAWSGPRHRVVLAVLERWPVE